MWTDWLTTSDFDADGTSGQREETLDLATGEDITSISGHSGDTYGFTDCLQAETSVGRQWGPFGNDSLSFRSSPPTSSGLRLNHLSGDQSFNNKIIRWLQL